MERPGLPLAFFLAHPMCVHIFHKGDSLPIDQTGKNHSLYPLFLQGREK